MPNWFAFISYVAIAAYTPGPNNITCMRNGIKLGLRKSIGYNFGVLVGFTIINFLTAVFGVALFQQFPPLKDYIKWIGCIYLLWLAWKVYQSSGSIEEDKQVPHTFWVSLLVQFLNIKGVFFSFTTNATFVLPYFQNLVTLLLISFIITLVSFSATILWSLFGVFFSRYLLKYEKIANVVMAGLLIYSATMLFM